jgi:hypothetical protein
MASRSRRVEVEDAPGDDPRDDDVDRIDEDVDRVLDEVAGLVGRG